KGLQGGGEGFSFAGRLNHFGRAPTGRQAAAQQAVQLAVGAVAMADVLVEDDAVKGGPGQSTHLDDVGVAAGTTRGNPRGTPVGEVVQRGDQRGDGGWVMGVIADHNGLARQQDVESPGDQLRTGEERFKGCANDVEGQAQRPGCGGSSQDVLDLEGDAAWL